MKRFLILVPIILLIILNSCDTGGGKNVPTPTYDWYAISQAGTATNMPPLLPTVTPNAQQILYALISSDLLSGGPDFYKTLEAKSAELEGSVGADYQITDARYTLQKDILVFQIFVRCSCATGKPCCNIEHMFVQTMEKLYLVNTLSPYTIQTMVPGEVQEMEVVCSYQKKNIGTISAKWSDVQSFLRGDINGTQFGNLVTPIP
jgi:hypothetical protein